MRCSTRTCASPTASWRRAYAGARRRCWTSASTVPRASRCTWTSGRRPSSRCSAPRGGRRIRSGQSAAQAGPGGLHPARLQRADPGHDRRAAGAPGAAPERMSRSGATWSWVEDNCPQRRRASAGTTPSAELPERGAAPRDRHRHGGDPLHVRQHRQAQRRRAVPSQHGGGREERRAVPRESRRTIASCPRCRCQFDAGFSQLTTAFHAGRAASC